MAYMCTDSGNLMAIAQQVIKQKQQQQQRHQHQQQNQEPVMPAIEVASSDADPFASVPPQWGSQQLQQQQQQQEQEQEQELEQEHTPIRDHFPFALTEPPFHDPFAAGILGFPPPAHLDHPPFRISEFDSDEWMDSLIGESPTESSEIMADVWQGSDLAPIFPDAFASCSTTMSLPSQASTSDLDRVVFPESCKILTAHHSLSFDPPPPPPPPPPKKDAADSKSTPPLFKSLLDCARIVDSDPDLAAKAVDRIRDLASDLGDPTERVAFYFSEALNRLLTGASAPDFQEEEIALCFRAFNDACPYSIFVHLTANQAILEATESAERIHIIDFGIAQGIQWAALLQALATRPTGKPSRIRISGIPAASLGGSPATYLAATGNRLLDFARLLDLDFEFDPVLNPVHDLTVSSFRLEPGEAVAVNFTLQLHTLLGDSDESVNRVIRLAKSVRPSVVTLGEYECNLNRTGFVERFGNALRYFTAVFDSVESSMGRDSEERARIERVILGPRILYTVGPEEGRERRVRMEAKEKWRVMMEGCGLEMVPLSNYAVSQAKLLLWNYDYSPKYSLLDSSTGFLSLAWDDLSLFTVSSWR